MNFDYFYIEQSEDYSFYRIPKRLFTEEMFEDLSVEAKVLYGLLLDRISLSRENGWIDENKRVYVFFKIETLKPYAKGYQEAIDYAKSEQKRSARPEIKPFGPNSMSNTELPPKFAVIFPSSTSKEISLSLRSAWTMSL